MPQQNFMPLQSSGPSQASAAPLQLPPAAVQVAEVTMPVTVTQQL